MPFIIIEERVQNVQFFHSVFLEQLEFVEMTFVIVYAVHLARKRIAMLAERTAERATAAGFCTHSIDATFKGYGARKIRRFEFPEPGQIHHAGNSLTDIMA